MNNKAEAIKSRIKNWYEKNKHPITWMLKNQTGFSLDEIVELFEGLEEYAQCPRWVKASERNPPKSGCYFTYRREGKGYPQSTFWFADTKQWSSLTYEWLDEAPESPQNRLSEVVGKWPGDEPLEETLKGVGEIDIFAGQYPSSETKEEVEPVDENGYPIYGTFGRVKPEPHSAEDTPEPLTIFNKTGSNVEWEKEAERRWPIPEGAHRMVEGALRHERRLFLDGCQFASSLDRKKAELIWEAARLYYNELREIEDDEPYMGWCDVDGCERESSNNGGCWRETGYWRCCFKHSDAFRKGEPQPKMKQSAIDREASRGEDGFLPIRPPEPIITKNPDKETFLNEMFSDKSSPPDTDC